MEAIIQCVTCFKHFRCKGCSAIIPYQNLNRIKLCKCDKCYKCSVPYLCNTVEINDIELISLML